MPRGRKKLSFSEKSFDDEQLIDVFEKEELTKKYLSKTSRGLTIKKIEPLTENQNCI